MDRTAAIVELYASRDLCAESGGPRRSRVNAIGGRHTGTIIEFDESRHKLAVVLHLVTKPRPCVALRGRFVRLAG